jgi:Segregation and condensation complex subunit ScpB
MMIEYDISMRSVEATLFASEEPMTVEQIRSCVGDAIDVSDALERLEEHYRGRGIRPGISRPLPTSPTCCAASARKAGSLAVQRSKRWRSSLITNPSAAPR